MSNENEVLAEIRRTIEDARKQFRARCRAILKQAYDDADSLSSAVGEISSDQAFEAWAQTLITATCLWDLSRKCRQTRMGVFVVETRDVS